MKKLFVSLITAAIFFAGCKTGVSNSSYVVTHNIEYELNYGEWVEGYTAPLTFYEGETLTLPDSTKIFRSGMYFEGWFDNAEFQGQSIEVIPSDRCEDINLYAKWVPNQSISLSNDYTPSLTLYVGDTYSDYSIYAQMPEHCLSSEEENYKFSVYIDDVCLTVIKTGYVAASYNLNSYVSSLEPGSHVIMVTVEIFGVPGSYSASKEFTI